MFSPPLEMKILSVLKNSFSCSALFHIKIRVCLKYLWMTVAMPELDKDFITSKIERAHRVKGNKYGTILPVITTFSEWTFPEHVKSSFIKVTNTKRMKSPCAIISSVRDVFRCFDNTMQWCNNKVKEAEKRWSSNTSILQISSSAYGQIPRGISLYIVCKISDWLAIECSPIYSTKLLNEIYYLISLISLVYIIFEGPSTK